MRDKIVSVIRHSDLEFIWVLGFVIWKFAPNLFGSRYAGLWIRNHIVPPTRQHLLSMGAACLNLLFFFGGEVPEEAAIDKQTLYDAEYFFVPNKINRYTPSSRKHEERLEEDLRVGAVIKKSVTSEQ